ncbi:MAG TPA: T9SS type A sorting domain-containing protein [candidate division Zixibacteria bacterium]|nr:T9SS type A sorting domain-containing protein [candidate division Zixibacteria bacterium]
MRRYSYIHASLGALIAVILCATAGLALDKPDFRISDDPGGAPQTAPRIAGQAGGDFVVCWLDRRLGRHEVYYQRLLSAGGFIEKNQTLSVDTSTTERFQVSLAASVSGRYSAVWKDYRNGSFPFQPDIYQAGLDSSGAPLGIEWNRTAGLADSIFEQPDVTLRPDGSGALVWAQRIGDGWDIVSQRFDASGAALGAVAVVNDDGSAAVQQHAPRVSSAASGWYVVTWYDNRNGDEDVFFQVFDSGGSPLGGNVEAAGDTTNSRQAFPAVACDGLGRFTLCWVDWRNGRYPDNPDIYARRFAVDGTPLGVAFRVTADTTGAAQREPAIASDRLGNVAIVWSDSSAGDWNIRGRLIAHTGSLSDSAFQINTNAPGKQAQPDVWLDGLDMRVVWADLRNGNFDIYGRILNYNEPALTLYPATIEVAWERGAPAPASQLISALNSGLGMLNFRAGATPAWLALTPDSATTPDTLTLEFFVDSLTAGVHFAEIPFVDLTNQDSSVTLSVTLTVTEPTPPEDTLAFGSTATTLGSVFQLPVSLLLSQAITAFEFPLVWDTTTLRFDSASFADTALLNDFSLAVTVDSTGNSALVSVVSLDSVSPAEFAPGTHSDALYPSFTAGLTAGQVSTAELVDSTATAFVRRASGVDAEVGIAHGVITIDLLSAVGHEPEPSLPSTMQVTQNYPNPFNPTTQFGLYLPRTAVVRAVVYNILGQRVRLLLDGRLPAGWSRVEWDGRGDLGDELPSGVYFYRVEALDSRETRKALLVK